MHKEGVSFDDGRRCAGLVAAAGIEDMEKKGSPTISASSSRCIAASISSSDQSGISSVGLSGIHFRIISVFSLAREGE